MLLVIFLFLSYLLVIKDSASDISANHRRLVKNEEMLEQRQRWLFHISDEGLLGRSREAALMGKMLI